MRTSSTTRRRPTRPAELETGWRRRTDMQWDRDTRKDVTARAIVALLFVLLSANLLVEFARTWHLTGLFLLVNESLVVILTLVRRRALSIDRSRLASLGAFVSGGGPPPRRPGGGPG